MKDVSIVPSKALGFVGGGSNTTCSVFMCLLAYVNCEAMKRICSRNVKIRSEIRVFLMQACGKFDTGFESNNYNILC